MPYDLEGELLRAAHELCRRHELDTFTCSALRDFIEREVPMSRLAHPLLAHSVQPLAERLVSEGCLARVDGGYTLTEQAHAYLRRSPLDLLRTPE